MDDAGPWIALWLMACAAGLVLWAVWKLTAGAGEAASSFRFSSPPQKAEPPAPTVDDQAESARAEYRRMVELIQAAEELPEEDRQALVNEQLDILERRLRSLRREVR